AQAAGIVRSDLDPELPFMMCVSVPLIYLASIHRFELIFTERDYSSPEALTRARDQIASLLVQGILTPAAAARYKSTHTSTATATPTATTQGEGEGDINATTV
ncbi:MAG: hypothetical protein ACRDHE_03675, partial [Ktedonobacterales bacterium]